MVAEFSCNSSKLKMLIRANVALAIILVAILAVIGIQRLTLLSDDRINAPIEYAPSSFSLKTESYDINPGNDYVLYTNYACPYCAAFYNLNCNFDYTTRIFLLKKNEGRFATQEIVSPYILKLYRSDAQTFDAVQSYLFTHQDEWIKLDDKGVLHLLNELSGKSWSAEDLMSELDELREIRKGAPDDLEFVPALFSDGKCYNDFVRQLVG